MHGVAHSTLGIKMSVIQNAFINGVIVAAPVVAAILFWTRFARFGAILMTLVMVGALTFGVYHHYVAVSVDHVDHLPAGDHGMFKTTAVVMAIAEALAAAVGVWCMLQLRHATPARA